MFRMTFQTLLILLLAGALVEGAFPIFTIRCGDYPEACNNDCFGVYTSGLPTQLNYDKGGPAGSRRTAAGCTSPSPCCNGKLNVSSTAAVVSCDEYPYAMTAEGGSGSVIRCINDSQNKGEGAQLGGFLRNQEEGCGGESCTFQVAFGGVTAASPYCVNKGGANDGYEYKYNSGVYTYAKRDQDTNQTTTPSYDLHRPDPRHYIPPEKRREFLLSNGERILLQSNDSSASFIDRKVYIHGTSGVRIVVELFDQEKSAPFRPPKRETYVPTKQRLGPLSRRQPQGAAASITTTTCSTSYLPMTNGAAPVVFCTTTTEPAPSTTSTPSPSVVYSTTCTTSDLPMTNGAAPVVFCTTYTSTVAPPPSSTPPTTRSSTPSPSSVPTSSPSATPSGYSPYYGYEEYSGGIDTPGQACAVEESSTSTSQSTTTGTSGSPPPTGSSSPPGTSPPGTSPPGTSPPGTNPPGTNPPGTNPPGTSPPGTSPPGTSPPGTSPPGTNPPGTNPPGTNPPGTNPPPGSPGPASSPAPGTPGSPGGSAAGTCPASGSSHNSPTGDGYWGLAFWQGGCNGTVQYGSYNNIPGACTNLVTAKPWDSVEIIKGAGLQIQFYSTQNCNPCGACSYYNNPQNQSCATDIVPGYPAEWFVRSVAIVENGTAPGNCIQRG